MGVEEVLDYLDALADQAARLPTYFPAHLRQADAGRSPFDAIHQRVQVVADRSAWDRWRAEERKRARAAGFEDDRRAYAPGRARPEGRLEEEGDRDSRPALTPPVSWDEHAAARFPRAVILGDPGFGKTWLLRYEARRLAYDAARVLRDRAGGLDTLILPLWARLPDLNQTNDLLENALAEKVEAAQGRSEAFRRFVLQRLEAGDAVVLLDAWDEVPLEISEPGQPIAYKPQHRQRLGQRLDAFAHRYPRCRVLLTSRIVGYDGSPILDAQELELFAFDWPQIEAFARAWFSDAEPFLALLQQNLQVRGLARIPLMLTLMCRASIEQQRHLAPAVERADALARRVSIYQLCLRGLLRGWRIEEKKEPIREGDVEAILEVLAPAAYALFAGGLEQFGEDVLRKEVRVSLQGLGASHELAGRDATAVIAELKHAGILITTGEYRDSPLLFLHRTFHEYLAARYLVQRAQAEGWEAIVALIDRKVWRSAWQEVIVLLAGQLADPVPLLQLLADGRRDDWFRHRLALAALCLTEIPADVRNPLVVDAIATEIVTVWVKHRREGTEAAVAHLMRALSAIAQASRQVLGETGWGMRLLTLCRDTDDRVQGAAADALGRLGPAALDWLLELIRDENWHVQEAATTALGGLGPAAAPALDRLLDLTRDRNWDVREAATTALGRLGPAAAPALDRLLDLTRDENRLAATTALGRLGPAAAPALDRLLDLTRDENWDVREAATTALGGLGPAAAPALDRLLDLTRDENWHMREAATAALGGLGPAAAPALDRLLELIRNGDRGVRWVAADALGRLGPAAAPALDWLLELIRNGDRGVREAATAALGGLGPAATPALDRLLELIRDENWHVRWAAAEALGRLGPAAAPALDRLRELMRDEDEDRDVRQAATTALGGLGALAAPAFDPLLLELTRDRNWGVRWVAAEALGRLGPAAAPALDRLRELTRDKHRFVQKAAAAALGRLGPAAAPALDRLRELTRDEDRDVRWVAAAALGGLGPAAAPALDRLLDLTRDEDRNVREAAARTLNRIIAKGVWIFKVPGWKRLFLGNRVVRRLEELDPEQPATS